VGFGYLYQLKAALAGDLQTGISGMVEVKYYTTRGKTGGLPSLLYLRKLFKQPRFPYQKIRHCAGWFFLSQQASCGIAYIQVLETESSTYLYFSLYLLPVLV
jgi:hypothetical protein